MSTLKAVEPLLSRGGALPLDDRPVFDRPPKFDAGEREQPVAGTPYSWADLRSAVEREQVEHLDDLLLRRTRIGNLLPHGGEQIVQEVLQLCRQRLGWDDARCADERERYRQIIERHYSLPG